MKKALLQILRVVDLLLLPLVYPAAWLLKGVRRAGVQNVPLCKKALLNVGVFPIRDHYFEPQFDFRGLKYPLSRNRSLPGIDWNIDEQLDLLDVLTFSQELVGVPYEKSSGVQFYMNNGSFLSGDAEYWYQLIRLKKPRRIFEIGSGYSTLMARKAIDKNRVEDPSYVCRHICIEPFEAPWLEKTGASILRKKVEDVEFEFFSELETNDILFIDSSHIIRPQGDVLYEYLEVLPRLNLGVIVHIHDIFSPRDYLERWIIDEITFWNEQYLLEAFLSYNHNWKIIGALNYLHHNHYAKLKSVAPFLTPDREPGSFYIQRFA